MAFIDMAVETCGALAREADPAAIVDVSCAFSFADVASEWLELQGEGVTTPYQTYDWSRSWSESAGAASAAQPLLVCGRDRQGRVVALLPLCVRRKRGVTVASFLGDRHSNINLGLFARRAMGRLTRSDIETMLRQAAAKARVDLFLLRSQPMDFAGLPNPLAQMPRIAGASSCWSTPLQHDGEAMIRSLRSSESLKKTRAKARKLAEIGPLQFVKADDVGSIQALLAAFLEQKSAQFQRMGVGDPYECSSVRDFLLLAMQPREGRPAPVSLWALKAGERIAAVFAGATHAGRRTGMFISYDADPSIARCSPGELLLQHVIRESCAEGLDTFDLGTGDGPYKKDYCPVQAPLFESVLPMTHRGRAAGLAISAVLAAKRAAKSNSLVLWSVERLRKAKASARTRAD